MKEIRALVEAADVAGERKPSYIAAGTKEDSITLLEDWKATHA